MVLYAAETVGVDKTPAFTAVPAVLRDGSVFFERLNVDAKLSAGQVEAKFLDDKGYTRLLTVDWPGLAPGLYEANDLEVTG